MKLIDIESRDELNRIDVNDAVSLLIYDEWISQMDQTLKKNAQR